MEPRIVSEDAGSVIDRDLRHLRRRTDEARCKPAIALTKKAIWMIALLSSLGVWAAVWATAASMASAWLQ